MRLLRSAAHIPLICAPLLVLSSCSDLQENRFISVYCSSSNHALDQSKAAFDTYPDASSLHAQRASQGKEPLWAFDRKTGQIYAYEGWPTEAFIPLTKTEEKEIAAGSGAYWEEYQSSLSTDKKRVVIKMRHVKRDSLMNESLIGEALIHFSFDELQITWGAGGPTELVEKCVLVPTLGIQINWKEHG